MSDVQIIKHGGAPAFAVVPYELWLSMTQSQASHADIPQAIIELKHKHNCSLISAWRRSKRISQVKLAEAVGVTQSAIAQAEKVGNQPQAGTLEKIAEALGVTVDQLKE
ncbi:XRE family transcriptional regulator [Parashewanella curva]|uniref:XRE family transcriptional regulator n=1 Tax=Parashewanella curva TaxID=2338552 RepID=A0A3L8Q284_9GAMM|nr:helix-turn-helix transcriptional regulator [Parashewanella curva]RLV60968.1 XRE family transcriptional regulator [Parashewanella curva]